ncbi:twin-arginine translocase TatA/TatE family subunit [Solidesulfovibrio sp.]|uniref:twin-arginine translocase TatA/TatE family subunit n=1 Tax=Solidesulfovibrio sp. TaxID=2910990 RepID=UPI002609FE7E|nr:twin-arginine translocase TatA/TatE family subunit [Solidesulfovibrio sp.]
MGLFEPMHLIVILVIALVIFGPGKIGDLGGSLGRAVRDFKKAMHEETPSAPPAEASPAAAQPELMQPAAATPAPPAAAMAREDAPTHDAPAGAATKTA